MPTYNIAGKTIRTEQALNDAQIEEITTSIASTASTKPSEEALPQPALGQPSAPQIPSNFSDYLKSGPFEQSTQSIARGMFVDPVNAARQFSGQEQRDQVAIEEAAFQKQRKEQGASGFDWFRVGGNVLSPAFAALAKTGQMASSALNLGKVGTGATVGGVSAIGMPVVSPVETSTDFYLQKLRDIGVSSAGSGVLSKIGAILSPTLRPGVKEQLEAGVKVPAGQAYEGVPGWVFRQMENIRFGPSELAIKQSFTQSAANEVLKSIGETIPKTIKDGRAASAYVERKISSFYNQAFTKIGAVSPDTQFVDDLNNAVAKTAQELDPNKAKLFAASIKSNIINKFKMTDGAPVADGNKLKEIDRYLKEQVAKYKQGTDAISLARATGYEDALNSFRAFTTRVDTTGLIAKADEAWANLYRFADAAKSAIKTGGSFGPEQLAQASARQATPLQAGSGQGPMGQFAREALDVLGQEKDELSTGYKALVIGGKTAAAVGGSALLGFNPFVIGPILISAGVSYKAAEKLMQNPSALRVGLEKAIQKLGPQTVASIVREYEKEKEPSPVEIEGIRVP